MWQRIRSTVKQAPKYLNRRFQSLELSYGDIAGKVFMLLIIIALGYNIYTAFNKGQDNLRRIEEEESRLAEIEAENANLQELEKYYSSVEYRRTYARDSWNLAEPGETLYYVQRDDTPPIEYLSNDDDPIILRDNAFWWQRLIFGG